MELELGTIVYPQLGPNDANPEACGLENHGEVSRSVPFSAAIVAQLEDLHPFANQRILSPPALSTNVVAHSVTSPQPALSRSVSTHSSQTLVFNISRSMSDLAHQTADNGTLEYGPAGGYRDRMRPSATQHYRDGRYCAALKAFVSGQRMYISIVTSVLMFGMTIAGLWIGIAGSHETLV